MAPIAFLIINKQFAKVVYKLLKECFYLVIKLI